MEITVPAGQNQVMTTDSCDRNIRHGNYGNDNRNTHDSIHRVIDAVKDARQSIGEVAARDAATVAVAGGYTNDVVKDTRHDLNETAARNAAVSAVASSYTNDIVKDTRHDLADVAARDAAAVALAGAHTNEESFKSFSHVNGNIGRVVEKFSEGFNWLDKSVVVSAKEGALATAGLASQAYQLNGQTLVDSSKNAAAILVDSTKNAASIAVASERIGNQLSNQATQNFNLVSNQATQNYNLVALQSERIAAAATLQSQNLAAVAALQAQTIASAATLQAQMLAAQAAAQAAECCCELKTAIHGEGEKTRELTNRLALEEANRKLVEVNSRLVAMQFCGNSDRGGPRGS